MNNKSRRRVKLAAGAVLAGAAIPIAAAGTAWADDPKGPNIAISIDGKSIESGSATADSGAVGDHNIAIAIGKDASADDSATGDMHDRAVARGTSSMATVDDSTKTTATVAGKDATVSASGDMSTKLTVHGFEAAGDATDATDVKDVAIGRGALASGFDETDVKGVAVGPDTEAFVEYSSDSRATAIGANSTAQVVGTAESPVTGSSAVDTNGTTTLVTKSDTHLLNGMPVMDTHMPLPLP